MRTIKFRGKRVDNGEWVYGYLVAIQDFRFAIKDTVYNVNNGCIDIIPSEVNPSTIGQFTGLQDKNGKDIYEGDWCSALFRTKDGIQVVKGFIFMDEFMWCIDCTGCVGDGVFSINRLYGFEIIGNIHDNPELLNQSL